MKYFFLFFIKLYILFISPFLGSNCRFYPTCSRYAFKSVSKHGVLIGFFLIFKRICNNLYNSL